jgi:DNA-binding response OmpR family regulator
MSGTSKIILIADNNPDYLRTVKQFFEVEGFTVRTAEDPTEARRVLETEPIDLTILDVRLENNQDEKDLSGLKLAMEVRPDVPKILLTDYPEWKDVRVGLSPTDEGKPPAVDYIAKEEGPEALLRAVRLALLSLPAALERKLLHEFEVPATVALRNRLRKISPEDAAARMGRAYSDASAEMRGHRDRESARASQLHTWGLIVSVVGILLIFVAVGFLITGATAGVAVTLVGDVVAAAVGVLFSRREDAAHKRVEVYYKQLDEISRADKILEISKSLESTEKRDEVRKKVIDVLLSGM